MLAFVIVLTGEYENLLTILRQLLGEWVATNRLEVGAKLDHSYDGVEVWSVQFGTCFHEA